MESKTLAGVTLIRNGLLYDYCFEESIRNMLDFCDAVYVVDAGSDDGTWEKLLEIKHPKLVLIHRHKEEWDAQQGTGKAKLCYFTDIAIAQAEKDGYDYIYSQQADEITHEDSFEEIRKAIATDAEAFMVGRINLWKTPYYQLDVPQERKPCSTSIIRLAKSCYRTYGDAESLSVPYVDMYFENGIQMWHYGFVRKKEVMRDKVINMQVNIFETTHDPKLDIPEDKIFNPDLWFDPLTDLKLINKPHPKHIREWVKQRP